MTNPVCLTVLFQYQLVNFWSFQEAKLMFSCSSHTFWNHRSDLDLMLGFSQVLLGRLFYSALLPFDLVCMFPTTILYISIKHMFCALSVVHIGSSKRVTELVLSIKLWITEKFKAQNADLCKIKLKTTA